MKNTLVISVIIAMLMLLLPLFSLKSTDKSTVSAAVLTEDIPATSQQTLTAKSYDSFRILIDGKVTELSAKEYIYGVVAAEMPAAYHEEALKAQTVAAYTFACYKKAMRTEEEYDLTTDSEIDQCYITKQEANNRWGEGCEEYAKKLDECIDEVLGIIVTFEGKTAQTLYHAISPGFTLSSQEVWGSEIEYLVSVESPGDTLAEGFLSEAVFTAQELEEKLKSFATPNGNAKDYFTEIVKTDSGRVDTLKYCSTVCNGSDIAKALSLRSSNFDVSFADDIFTFSVKGYGHGVGLSQNGANYMAKQGADYQEILLHYYKGCLLAK